MKKFLIKILIITSPLIIVSLVYIITDPFKVLYSYDAYYKTGINRVTLNKGFVSFETLKKNYPKYNPNAFILGSSRSMVYHEDFWTRYRPEARVFHFDAWGESLYGIDKKADYLLKRKIPVKYALLILDKSLLSSITNSKETIYRTHPYLTGEWMPSFQLRYYKTYLDPVFVWAYCDLLINDTVREYMKKRLFFGIVPAKYIVRTNELSYPIIEDSICKYPDRFYASRLGIFKRDSIREVPGERIIKKEQLKMLANIKEMFDVNHTEYAVVISPSYSMVKLHNNDLVELQNLFGKNKVFDFTGMNEMSLNKTNFYDRRHYRSTIAKQIIDSIYNTKPFK